MDFFENVGVLAIASRLRRLTDRMSADDVKIYELFGLDFKPKWFTLFATLMDCQKHTVTSIAKETGLSHSSISVMAKEMQSKNLLQMSCSDVDARKTDLCLTDFGIEKIPAVKRMMLAGEKSVNKLLNSCSQNLWYAIGEWEKLLDEQSLFDRVKEAKEQIETIVNDNGSNS